MNIILSLLFLLIAPTFGSNLGAGIEDLKLEPISSLDRVQIIHVENIKSITMNMFAKHDNVIMVKETNSSIMHQSTLDTASRISGTPFRTQLNDSKLQKNTWYEFKTIGSTQYLGPKRPLTGCLSNSKGDGGSLSSSFSKTFGKSSFFDLSYGYALLTSFSVAVGYSFTIESYYTVSGSYSCTVPANTTGQVFIQPYYLEYQDPQIRKVNIIEGRVWPNPFTLSPHSAVYDEWESIDSLVVLSPESRPIFTCVTEESLLACDEEILGDTWQI